MLLGEHIHRRHGVKPEPAVEVLRAVKDQVSPETQDLLRMFHRPEDGAAIDRVDRSTRKRKEVTTPKLPPPPRTAQNRSAFSFGAGSDETAVGQDHIHAQQVIDRQAIPAGEIAHAAAEGQAAHTGGGEETSRHCQAERVGRVIDVAPGRSRLRRAPFWLTDRHGCRSCVRDR